MDQQKVRNILANLFKTSKREDNEEYIHFNTDYMRRENTDSYAVYQAVSNAGFESGLTHSFSYEIMSRAADILADLADWNDDDAIIEAVDQGVPIYTNELMQIYVSNSWAVDEAAEEYGSEGDSTDRARWAWGSQIRSMVYAIRTNIAAI